MKKVFFVCLIYLFSLPSAFANDRDIRLNQLFNDIGVPKNLSSYNISMNDYEEICKIMKTQQVAFDQNPVKFSVEKDFPKFIKQYME